MKRPLEPIFEAQFLPHSYGFRPRRSQHQAAQQIVNSGKPYVGDIDLWKFFDRIYHDRLIARMEQSITDKWILRLIETPFSPTPFQSNENRHRSD